jgi:hypothetical protein
MRRYYQMNYRQILDDQIKSKNYLPVSIPLEPHLEQRYFNQFDNSNINFYLYLNNFISFFS